MNGKTTKDTHNQDNPKQGPKKPPTESLKLDDEENKVEFVIGEGRPENFLGLQDQSSGI
jgi:hypothetical protein